MDNEAQRVAAWRALCADPASDPFPGMAEAGLFAPAGSYGEIARIKGLLTEQTGLIGVGSVWGGRQMVGRYFIATHGSAEQREAWLGRAASVAISEPGAGAHPKHLRTRAEADGAAYCITGEKAWVTNGPSADVIIVVAITAEEANGRKRYSAFLVPRDTPGLTLKEMPGFDALRPSRHCGVVLDHCRVPASSMLGAPDTAYEKMALPFRDAEDAVGLFGLLGAFRYLLGQLGARCAPTDDIKLVFGGLAGLIAVFEAGAEKVVAALDADRLAEVAATLIGLRVLAADLDSRFRTQAASLGAPRDEIDRTLHDLEASLSVARGPRQSRQSALGAGVMAPDAA
jgi:acyl-CoA dehydrogenase